MPVCQPDGGILHQTFGSFHGDGPGVGSGSFQATAAAITTISDASIPASANIICRPANAAAGLLMRSATCFVPTGNSAGSFTFQVSATGAGAPGGSETFAYFFCVENP